MSARAIITRCDWPPEKKSGFARRPVDQPELRQQLVRARLALARRHAVVGGVEDQVVADRDRAVEVAALRHDRELAAGPTGSRDDVDAVDRARPLVGRTRVVRTPTVVVLPAPFGPSSPNTSPGRIANETPSTALTRAFG